MTYVATTADKLSSGRNISFSGNVALVIASFTLASGAAAWIADSDQIAWVSNLAPPKAIDALPFEARFFPGSAPNSLTIDQSPHSFVESLPPELEVKLQQAKNQLAQKLQSQDWRQAIIDESPKSISTAVPLPRSRPMGADLESRGGSITAQADNRTLLQKFSDLFPARITLASLAPDGGLLGGRPDLASLGYDNLKSMQWYVNVVSLAATGVLGWAALEFVARPFRQFFDLRRQLRQQLLTLANISPPKPRETVVTSQAIREYDEGLKNAREAQRILRDYDF